MSTEKLIELVKKFPILYDKSNEEHSDAVKKRLVWKIIAGELNLEHENVAKQKWRHVRDSYMKHLRTLFDTKEVANKKWTMKYQTWPWAKSLEFLKPYINSSSRRTRRKKSCGKNDATIRGEASAVTFENVKIEPKEPSDVLYDEMTKGAPGEGGRKSENDEEEEEEEDDDDEEKDENDGKDKKNGGLQERKGGRGKKEARDGQRRNCRIANDRMNDEEDRAVAKDSKDSSWRNVERCPLERGADSVDLLFLSYAKTLKTFSEETRAITKLKIAEVMVHAEIHEARKRRKSSGVLDPLSFPSSSSGRKS